MFELTKVFGFATKIYFLFFLVSMVALYFFYNKPRVLSLLFSCLLVFLYIISCDWFRNVIVYPLESEFYRTGMKIIDPTTIDAIVVLGAGIEIGLTASHTRPNFESMARLHKGVSVYRKYKESIPLILSGGLGDKEKNRPAEADVFADFIRVGYGIKQAIIENESRNTYENGFLSLKKIPAKALQAKIILVTSALHMKRSRAVFETLGCQVVAVPSHFHGSKGDWTDLKAYLPQAKNLQIIHAAMHEYLGYVYYLIRGYLNILDKNHDNSFF